MLIPMFILNIGFTPSIYQSFFFYSYSYLKFQILFKCLLDILLNIKEC